MSNKLLFRLAVLVAAMMCALGASAIEAYACYTPSNATLTFYYDNLRSSRTGTTYDLNAGNNQPVWFTSGINSSVTRVVFESSFANARPTSTYAWFLSMENLQSITGLQYLNTSEVTKMGAMFMSCSGLTSLDVSHFDTEQVTDMFHMFYGCSNLTSLDVSNFNTAQVTDMRGMFRECSKLTSLDLSGFNTALVRNMSMMFNGDSQLATIYVDVDWSTAILNYSNEMFSGCTSLVGGMGTTYDANHVDKEYAHIDYGPSNPGYLTQYKEAYAVYNSQNTTLTFYYDQYRDGWDGQQYKVYDLNEDDTTPGWSEHCEDITRVVFQPSFEDVRPTTTYMWFSGMSFLETIENMHYLNTEQVTNMQSMFDNCNSLTSLDVSGFNTSNVTNMYSMFFGCYSLTSINVSHFNTAKVTDMCHMFNGCSGLTSINVSNFNTAKVTIMAGMFRECSGLTSLNLSSFNTANVTNMSFMFYECSNLVTIYVGMGWNTDAVTSSGAMFDDCTRLVGGMGTTYSNANPRDKTYAHIDGGPDNPGYLTEYAQVYAVFTPGNTTLTFYYDDQKDARPGTVYEISNKWNCTWSNTSVTRVVFDPSFAAVHPTKTQSWFASMSNLQSITGLEYLNTDQVTTMFEMFSGCSSLTSIDLSHFNTANVRTMQNMFNDCYSLTSLDLSGFNTANVTSMLGMFYGCRNLKTLDLSSFNTANVTTMYCMFYTCSGLETIYVGGGWNTDAVTQSNYMFNNCTKLVGGMGTTYNANFVDKTYAHIDGGPSNPGYLTAVLGPAEAYAVYTEANSTLAFYYDGLRSYRPGTTYDLNKGYSYPGWYIDGTYSSVTQAVFDSSFADARPTTTYRWFNNMTGLTTISGLHYLNTSEVTNMSCMFGYTGLTSLNLSNFNTSNVTDMSYMFQRCSGLTSLDLSSFNTANVKYMYYMFQYCSSLTSLDLSNFNNAKVTNMNMMFDQCSGLTSIDLSGFNTAKVIYMGYMFRGCSGLSSLDLSSFNTANVKEMNYMFFNSGALKTIYVGDGWSTAAVNESSEMFKYCTSLVGYMGTTYDASHVDKAYAHIDGGPDNPGYLSEKLPEAYACYTPENTTLTFYYDDQRYSRPGTVYGLDDSYESFGVEYPGWFEYQTRNNLTQVVFDPSFADARPTTTFSWFAEMSNLESISGMEYLNTEEVTDMSQMFYCSYELTDVDLSHFNTSKVTDMNNMFACWQGTTLDLSSFNTSQVTNMMSMFYWCYNLTTIYAGDGWSTASLEYSDYMFNDCTSLVGGMGTTFDGNHIDAAYAHIDGGPSNPGYFSEKGGAFLRGDVNGDGSVNISDVTALINYLLSSNASGIDLSAADCSQDSLVNISDVTALINYLLSGSWN